MPPTYDHAFSLGFSIQGSTHHQGDDLTAQQYREAVIRRVDELGDDKAAWEEACGMPFDSFEE